MTHRFGTTVLSAATIFVAAFGLSGCSDTGSAPTPTAVTTTTAAGTQGAALPEPGVLTDVLARLTDPAVPGDAKLALIEGATAAETTSLDNFTKALADNHMLPLTFTADDVAWSEQNPGKVLATVTATSAKEGSVPFTFPMEFIPTQLGWQLSRETTDLLLALGEGGAGAAAPVAPAPPPASTPAPAPANPPR